MKILFCEELLLSFFFQLKEKKYFSGSKMGCLKLTYREENPTLKVVRELFSNEEKSSVSTYRYGFNGYEKDDEVKGSGNHYSFSDFGYDP